MGAKADGYFPAALRAQTLPATLHYLPPQVVLDATQQPSPGCRLVTEHLIETFHN